MGSLGVGGERGEVYDPNYLGMCESATQYKDPNKIIEVKKIGFIDKGTGEHESNIVYDSNGVSPCVTASFGVKQPPTMHVDIVALDEQNKCFRNETFGTLTTDGSSPKHNNRVVEVKKIGGVLGDRQAGSVYDKDGISPSLIAGMSHGNNMPYITEVQKYDRQINNDRSDG